MQQGWVVLALGMATVFSFLLLLVAAMSLSATFFTRFARRFPDEPPPSQAPGRRKESEVLAVAIAAAHARFRS